MNPISTLAALALGGIVMLTGCATPTLTDRVAEGNLVEAKAMVGKGADVNRAETIAYQSRISPLVIAAKLGRVDLAKFLIDNGAKVNYTYDDPAATSPTVTPLQVAAMYGRDEMVKLLIDNGAKINFPWVLGKTPLTVACEQGHLSTAILLIQKGANTSGRSVTEYCSVISKQQAEQLADQNRAAQRQAQAQREFEQQLKDKERRESSERWQWAGAIVTGLADACRSDPKCANQKPGDSLAQYEAQANARQRELVNNTNRAYQEQNARTLSQNQKVVEQGQERLNRLRSQNQQQSSPSSYTAGASTSAGGAAYAGGAGNTAAPKVMVGSISTSSTSSNNSNQASYANNPASYPVSSASDSAEVKLIKGDYDGCHREADNLSNKNRTISKNGFASGDDYKCESSEQVSMFTGSNSIYSSASQSTLCARAKSSALNSSKEIVRDFGCGCFINNGNLVCTEYVIVNYSAKSTGGGGGGGIQK